MDTKILFSILGIALLILFIKYMVKSFSVYQCTGGSGVIKLTGQLKHGTSIIIFQNSPGRHCYEFIINKGKLRLNHHSFNPDGFTWSLPPRNGDKKYYEMETEGFFKFFISIGTSYGKEDRIELVNTNLWEDVEVKYQIDC